ncbi:MAG: methylamine utilization protein MauE [Gammaproteobacteria bacterium]|nr:MAG: methylamine utilization protein MauE [Gammaproteobacteria bacterium]TLZ48089.1 MAG: methylamine utilization protein MauE [Gammaproteobacteria bacterium]
MRRTRWHTRRAAILHGSVVYDVRTMIDPAVGAMLAGAFALLFVSAALDKLRSLQGFAEVFRAYRLLPDGVARLSWLVPALELTVGVGLLARRSRAGAGAAGAALLVAYAAAIAINLQRGRRDLACGCGGPHARRPIAAWMAWRNLLLAGLLAPMLLPWIVRPMAAADAVTIGAGTAVAALLYMSLDRLLAQVTPRTAPLRGSR